MTCSICKAEIFDPQFEVIDSCRVFSGYFSIDSYEVLINLPESGATQRLKRFVFERGDAAAVLLLDYSKHQIGLVRQFRLPPGCRGENPWFLEIVAGSMKPEENPGQVAGKEIEEETGAAFTRLVEKGMVYLSPGGSTERCFLFFAEVDSLQLLNAVGGEAGSDEKTWLEVFDFSEIPKLLADGCVIDAKTVIALQRLMLELGMGEKKWN